MCLTDFIDCRYIAHGWYFRPSCELLPPWTKELKTTNPKCRLYWCLIEFIDRRCSQSCWYFRPSFVNYCPLTFSLVHLPHPSPLPKDIIYRQCGREGVRGVRVVLRPYSAAVKHCFLPDSETTKLLYHPKQKPGMGGGLRQENTCRKSIYRLILLDNYIWHCFLSV